MIFRPSRPRLLAAIAAVLLIAGIAFWLFQRAPSADSLLAALPEGDGTTLYVNFGLLRRAQVLDLLGGKAIPEEPDYRKFVESAGFDYRRDLDSAVLQMRDRDVLIVAAGRFDLERLATYVQVNGGRCVRGLCSIQGSVPERQISFTELKRGVLAVAVSPDPLAASIMSFGARNRSGPRGSGPVWLYLPGAHLKPSEGLPPGLSSLLGALEGASHALFSLAIDRSGVSLNLEAPCRDSGQATAASDKLKHATEMLIKLLQRENRAPDPKDLSGVLAAGEFRADGAVVRGRWPLAKAFLDELTK